MKKILLWLPIIVLTILSGCKSKEEKAIEMIKKEMFKTLYDYESYQPIETTVDSAFYSPYTDSTILSHGYVIKELLSEANKNLEEIKEAHTSMEIWSDSYSSYGLTKYYDAKEKMSSALEKGNLYIKYMNIEGDSIRMLSKDIKSTFYGWKVTHKFRCKTKGGNSTIGNYVYIFDKKIEHIIYKEDTEDEDLINTKSLIKECLEKEVAFNDTKQTKL